MSTSIPKILHQTWKDNNVPEQWKAYQEKAIALHPGWEYRLWTDDANDAFIKQHYPDLFPIYNAYPKPVMKADVIRYAIMDQMGGYYLDLDYEMLKPFGEREGLVLPKSRDKAYGDADDRIGNCVMGSSPGHPFWKKVLQDLTDHPFEIGSEELDVEKATGPYLLTRIFYEGSWNNCTTPPRLEFHPPSPRNAQQYDQIIHNGISHGIHHAHGSWRASGWKKFLQKIGLR